MSRTITRKTGEGQALWMLNSLYEIKVSSDETDGAATVVEMTIPEGWGPPPHVHNSTETVYVLDGTVRYHIGDETFEGGPGSVFFVPEGIPEHFEPVDGPVRVLVTYQPGGMDRFFLDAGEPARARELPPVSEPPDMAALMALAERHGLRLIPPS